MFLWSKRGSSDDKFLEKRRLTICFWEKKGFQWQQVLWEKGDLQYVFEKGKDSSENKFFEKKETYNMFLRNERDFSDNKL